MVFNKKKYSESHLDQQKENNDGDKTKKQFLFHYIFTFLLINSNTIKMGGTSIIKQDKNTYPKCIEIR